MCKHVPGIKDSIDYLELSTPVITGQDSTAEGVSSALLSGFLTASWIMRKNLGYMIKK